MNEKEYDNYIDEQIRHAMDIAQPPAAVGARVEQTLAGIAASPARPGEGASAAPATSGTAGASDQVAARRRAGFRAVGWRRVAAIAVAAALGVSGTAYAAGKLFNFGAEQTASYQAEVSLAVDDGYQVPDRVDELDIQLGYIPEGLEPYDKGEVAAYHDPVLQDRGFIIEQPVVIDEADPLTLRFVKDFESLQVGGRDALLVQTEVSPDPEWVGKDLYVVYPEYDRIVKVWGWGHIPQDEVIKIAENLQVTPTGNTQDVSGLALWSEVVANMNAQWELVDEAGEEPTVTATAEQMANVHQVGEAFNVGGYEHEGGDVKLQARVADVTVSDDLSGLADADAIPDEWIELLDADGKLGQATRSYVQQGDGVESVNQVLLEESYDVKLVTLAVEYTNLGDADAQDVWFMADRMALVQDADGSYQVFDRTAGLFDQDDVYQYGMPLSSEMGYFDVHGGPRSNNYIPALAAGETATVNMAWIVPADELDKMYVSVNGGGWLLSEDNLAVGLVDVRQ